MSRDFSDILADPRAPAPPTPSTARSASQVAVTPDSTPHAVPGTILRVSIITEDWESPGTREVLDCGQFEIDGITLDYGAAGNTVSISAASVPLQRPIRREEKTRGWEDCTLRQVAQDVAQNGGLSLVYELDGDTFIDRIDQRSQSDLAFLRDLARRVGASVKVTDRQLIVFDEAKYEQRAPVFTFRRGDKRLISASFSQDTSNCAGSAETSYKDPQTGRLISQSFRPGSGSSRSAPNSNVPINTMGQWHSTSPAVGNRLPVNSRPLNTMGQWHSTG